MSEGEKDALLGQEIQYLGRLLGEAIKRIHRGESVGALFSSEVSFTQEMLLWDEGGDSAPGSDDGAASDDGEPSRAAVTASVPRAAG